MPPSKAFSKAARDPNTGGLASSGSASSSSPSGYVGVGAPTLGATTTEGWTRIGTSGTGTPIWQKPNGETIASNQIPTAATRGLTMDTPNPNTGGAPRLNRTGTSQSTFAPRATDFRSPSGERVTADSVSTRQRYFDHLNRSNNVVRFERQRVPLTSGGDIKAREAVRIIREQGFNKGTTTILERSSSANLIERELRAPKAATLITNTNAPGWGVRNQNKPFLIDGPVAPYQPRNASVEFKPTWNFLKATGREAGALVIQTSKDTAKGVGQFFYAPNVMRRNATITGNNSFSNSRRWLDKQLRYEQPLYTSPQVQTAAFTIGTVGAAGVFPKAAKIGFTAFAGYSAGAFALNPSPKNAAAAGLAAAPIIPYKRLTQIKLPTFNLPKVDGSSFAAAQKSYKLIRSTGSREGLEGTGRIVTRGGKQTNFLGLAREEGRIIPESRLELSKGQQVVQFGKQTTNIQTGGFTIQKRTNLAKTVRAKTATMPDGSQLNLIDVTLARGGRNPRGLTVQYELGNTKNLGSARLVDIIGFRGKSKRSSLIDDFSGEATTFKDITKGTSYGVSDSFAKQLSKSYGFKVPKLTNKDLANLGKIRRGEPLNNALRNIRKSSGKSAMVLFTQPKIVSLPQSSSVLATAKAINRATTPPQTAATSQVGSAATFSLYKITPKQTNFNIPKIAYYDFQTTDYNPPQQRALPNIGSVDSQTRLFSSSRSALSSFSTVITKQSQRVDQRLQTQLITGQQLRIKTNMRTITDTRTEQLTRQRVETALRVQTKLRTTQLLRSNLRTPRTTRFAIPDVPKLPRFYLPTNTKDKQRKSTKKQPGFKWPTMYAPSLEAKFFGVTSYKMPSLRSIQTGIYIRPIVIKRRAKWR